MTTELNCCTALEPQPELNRVLWLWVPAFPGTTVIMRHHACTIRHTTAPSDPTHSTMQATAWMAKPGLRLATASR